MLMCPHRCPTKHLRRVFVGHGRFSRRGTHGAHRHEAPAFAGKRAALSARRWRRAISGGAAHRQEGLAHAVPARRSWFPEGAGDARRVPRAHARAGSPVARAVPWAARAWPVTGRRKAGREGSANRARHRLRRRLCGPLVCRCREPDQQRAAQHPPRARQGCAARDRRETGGRRDDSGHPRDHRCREGPAAPTRWRYRPATL